jgi:hypothetical protein
MNSKRSVIALYKPIYVVLILLFLVVMYLFALNGRYEIIKKEYDNAPYAVYDKWEKGIYYMVDNKQRFLELEPDSIDKTD